LPDARHGRIGSKVLLDPGTLTCVTVVIGQVSDASVAAESPG
jgi:hypothetical protein